MKPAGATTRGANRVDAIDQVVRARERLVPRSSSDVFDLGGDEPEVDRDRDEPGTGERDIELHPLQAVVGEQRDSIALDQTETRKCVGEARCALVPLREGQRPAGVADTDPVRLQSRLRRDDIGDSQQMTHGKRRARSASSHEVSA
jgi:hypothetical protein